MISWSFTRFPSSADRLLWFIFIFFRCTLTWLTSCTFTACASLRSLLTQFSNTIEIIQPKYPNLPWVNKLCKAAAFLCVFDRLTDTFWTGSDFMWRKKTNILWTFYSRTEHWAFRSKGPINVDFVLLNWWQWTIIEATTFVLVYSDV